MLTETLTALAAAGGTALVQSAGTDAWTGMRQRVAKLLGREDAQRERAELERLDQTAAAVETAADTEAEQVRNRQELFWQSRLVTMLESLDSSEREQVAVELRALVGEAEPETGEGAAVSHNTFNGPTAFQIGHRNRQDIRFGPGG